MILLPPVRPEDALARYVNRDRSPAEVTVSDRTETSARLSFSSGDWRGAAWRHSVLWRKPKDSDGRTAILFITGDGPRDGDLRDIALLSQATSMPIAMLFDIPNQPLFGLKEDDLIAHTFQKYLDTGDRDWPLLLPMARAAIRAMDVIERTYGVKRFVVTGASKRGWTTWLTAATGDPRIVGIAPMVFDNLDFARQLPHQKELWGDYSPQIQDYIRRGLQARLEEPRGRELLRMVDPWTYRNKIRMPKLVVNGANDPYWATDAFRIYRDGLKGATYLNTTPNAGHDLGPKLPAIAAVGAFARSLAGRFRMPRVTFREKVADGTYTLNVDAPGARRIVVWGATAETGDLRKAEWTRLVTETGPKSRTSTRVTGVAGIYAEAVFAPEGREFSLCTPVKIVRQGVK